MHMKVIYAYMKLKLIIKDGAPEYFTGLVLTQEFSVQRLDFSSFVLISVLLAGLL